MSIITKFEREEAAIAIALSILERRLRRVGEYMDNPKTAKAFFTLKFAGLEHEVFSAIFIDAVGRLICYKELFRGTLSYTGVYPREIAKEALKVNAASVILGHNHPSGKIEPSEADNALTKRLKESLALVDVRLNDHIIVGGVNTFSYSDKGLI